MKWFSRKKKRPDVQAIRDEISAKDAEIGRVCKTLRYIARKHTQNIDIYHMELSKKRRLEAEKEALIALRCHLTGNCIETFSIPE